jgi:uncharacterized membrane protein
MSDQEPPNNEKDEVSPSVKIAADHAGSNDDADNRPPADPDYDRHGAWGWRARHEPRWPATVAVLGAMALYSVLPDRVIVGLGPTWVVPLLEGVLLVMLTLARLNANTRESGQLRALAISIIALVNAVNVVSLVELVHDLLGGTRAGGRALVYASVPIWITNVIVFALWYWELDRGGPVARQHERRRRPDFLFPQMSTPQAAPLCWTPTFLDYLYTSFTNATAFSPTDTMPLTAWAKLLMMGQSLASLVTVALVVSRAVNILGG